MSGQHIIIEQLREKLEKAHAASEYQTRRIEHYRTQLDFCERRAEKAERFIATADSEWKARAEKAEREFADRLDHLTAAVKRGDDLQARATELEKRLAASRAIVEDLKSTIRREEVRGDTAIRERDEARAERDERKARHDTLADVSRKCIATAERERDEARANYAFMVKRAADQKLDGYRELGARAAAAEERADRAERERDEARAERDARPDISAEDARAFMMFKPVPARDSREGPVMHALRAHAAKAVNP